jgi:hypothetical protein
MEQEPIQLRRVRFKVYHQGMGADVGDCLDVDAKWAERALKTGIVEAVDKGPGPEAEK